MRRDRGSARLHQAGSVGHGHQVQVTSFASSAPEDPQEGDIWIDSGNPRGVNLMGDSGPRNPAWVTTGGYASPAGTANFTLAYTIDGQPITWAATRASGGAAMLTWNAGNLATIYPRFPRSKRVHLIIKGTHSANTLHGTLKAAIPGFHTSEQVVESGAFTITTQVDIGAGTSDTDNGLFGLEYTYADSGTSNETTTVTYVGAFDLSDPETSFPNYIYSEGAWNQLGEVLPRAGRNLVTNGSMQIAQRGVTATATANTTVRTCDKWFLVNTSDATIVLTQETATPPPGLRHYIRMTHTVVDSTIATSQYIRLHTSIEGNLCKVLRWGTNDALPVTVSYWVRSSLTGQFGTDVNSVDINWASQVAHPSVSLANTWERKTWQVKPPPASYWTKSADSTYHLQLGFTTSLAPNTGGTYYNAGTGWDNETNYGNGVAMVNRAATLNSTFDISGVQFEVGRSATPFEVKDYPTELRECQRYFQRWTQPPMRGVIDGAGKGGRIGMPLPVEMAVAPSGAIGAGGLPIYDGSGTSSITALGTAYNTTQKVEFDVTTQAAALGVYRPAIIYQTGGATAYLDLTCLGY